jgi:hypothetical protein
LILRVPLTTSVWMVSGVSLYYDAIVKELWLLSV